MKRIDPLSIQLVVPGITHVPQLGCRVEAHVLNAADKPSDKSTALFDLDALAAPLYVRTRLPGDRFYPMGMHGHKKLKDFFIDAKVAREKRDRTLVFCDAEGIIWIGEYRQAERGKVTNNTSKFLQLTIKAGGLK
jgi:tRNA(Ile)-lysidine synthase